MNACECLAALFAVVATASSENFQCLISLPEMARRYEITSNCSTVKMLRPFKKK